MNNSTPLDGYKKISVTVLTTLLTCVLFFVKDPVHAATIEQFFSGVLIPMVPVAVGMMYTVIQGGIDKEKVKASAYVEKAKVAAAPASSDVIASPDAIGTRQSPGIAAVTVETYTPVDIPALVAKAEDNIKADGQMITPMTRAYYFWPSIVHFDLRDVPRQLRIDESKRLVDKGIELFTEAFKFHTKLAKPPTAAQASNIHSYMLTLKKEYEKANNLLCSDKTFEELRSMVTYFNDLYTAADGLSQLAGKTIDWSIYGSTSFGPTQVGWDFARLL
ncbi:MAG: hypothetical protein PHO26_06745 [Dehalococcoidia bacterium]|nr:hypothetical protein [Dehalococcoidia bacterium]MDD5494388.1 hypothetical protein [Dehalococcoidia bacterium]